ILARHHYSRYSLQIRHNAYFSPVAQQLSNRLLLRIANLHHQPCAGLEHLSCLRNQATVDIQTLLPAKQSAMRLMFPYFDFQFVGFALTHIRRIRYDHVKALSSVKTLCEKIALHKVDAVAKAKSLCISACDLQS